MKGIFFARPLEFRLESAAEGLRQGDSLHGNLTVLNQDSQAVSDLRLELALAYAVFRRIKTHGPTAYNIIERQILAEGFKLAAKGNRQAEWQMILPMDAPISSKEGSLFLLYGTDLSQAGAFGALDIPVGLASVLDTFITVCENRFAFKQKNAKFNKGFAEVVLAVPDHYPSLMELSVRLRLHEGALEVVFLTKAQTLDKKGTKVNKGEFAHTLPADQVMLNPTMPNRPLFQQTIRTVLEGILPPGALP